MSTPTVTRRLFALTAAFSLTLSSAFAADTAAVPAPVPAVVAIARPSAAEITQASESLKRFVAQADPATKAIFAKYPDIIAVRPPRVNPAVVPALTNAYRAKHNNYVEIADKGDIDVLFMGDSITDFWRTTGKEVFEKNYGAMKVANFGISGDSTQGVLYRLQNGEGQGFQPKAIMLMIGTNNTGAQYGAGSSAEIAEGVGAIVLEMRKDFPAAKILLLGTFPRTSGGDAVRKTVADVNPIIAQLHDGKNVFYLDIGAKFLDAQGNIPRDVMGDGLHPTAKGYEIWAEAVKAPLADLMK